MCDLERRLFLWFTLTGETKRNAEVRRVNIIIQLKVQNHQNTFEATLTTILHGRSFEILQKNLRPGRT